ncbi:uncharacterized protein LOC144766813 [Lissotriton helveticus]
MRVEEALWKKKARQSQKDAIELWRKEAHKRTEKEVRKSELSRESQGRAQERELIEIGEQVKAEQSDRQRHALIKGMYPLLAEGVPKATPEASSNFPPPLIPTKLRHKPTAADIFISSYLDDTVPEYANPVRAPPVPVNQVIHAPSDTGVPLTAPPAQSAIQVQPTLQLPTLPGRRMSVDDSSLGAARGGPPQTPPPHKRLTLAELHAQASQRTPRYQSVAEIRKSLAECCYDPVPGEDNMVLYSFRVRKVAEYLVTLPNMKEDLDRIYRFIRTGDDPESIGEIMSQRKAEIQLMILKFLINCLIREQDYPSKDSAEMRILTRWSDNIAEGKHKTVGAMESMYKKIRKEIIRLHDQRKAAQVSEKESISDPEEEENENPARIAYVGKSRFPDRHLRLEHKSIFHHPAPEQGSLEQVFQATDHILKSRIGYSELSTMHEQELARSAVRWITDSTTFPDEIVAQMFLKLPPAEQRLVGMYMIQHLITLYEGQHSDPGPLHDILNELLQYRWRGLGTDLISVILEQRHKYRTFLNPHFVHVSPPESKPFYIDRQNPLREVHPVQGAGGVMQRVFVYTPISKMELLEMKKLIPCHDKDPAGFHRELKDMLRMGEYTYPDIIKMLKVLLPAGVYEKLKEKEWEVGEKKIDWAALEAEDKARVPGTGLGDKCKELPELLIQVLPRLLTTRKEDWDAISACKQKQDEDISDFYSRFEKCFSINSGLKTSSESYPHLFVTKLVENSSPQIKNRVLKVESTWQANTPSQMLQMLQYHQNRIREEQEHERKRMKDTKMKVLVAQSVPQDSQKRGPNQASHPAAPVKGNCNYCKQPGHFINECAVLKHNIATGKTKERPRPPRQEQVSQIPQPQNAQQTVPAPQPIAATQHVTSQMYQYAQSEYPEYQPYS